MMMTDHADEKDIEKPQAHQPHNPCSFSAKQNQLLRQHRDVVTPHLAYLAASDLVKWHTHIACDDHFRRLGRKDAVVSTYSMLCGTRTGNRTLGSPDDEAGVLPLYNYTCLTYDDVSRIRKRCCYHVVRRNGGVVLPGLILWAIWLFYMVGAKHARPNRSCAGNPWHHHMLGLALERSFILGDEYTRLCNQSPPFVLKRATW